MEVISLEKAKGQGALAFFSDKYDEQVKVYSIGNFSKEVCGGPHVSSTGKMGYFRIKKEVWLQLNQQPAKFWQLLVHQFTTPGFWSGGFAERIIRCFWQTH